MAKVDKVKRWETVALDAKGATPDAAGMLRAPVTLTRTGVFPYRNADGSIRRELRLPEEVFSQPSMDSFELVPFVDEHPYAENGEVTAENAKRLQVGSVGKIRQNGNKLDGDVRVTDEATVAKVLSGKVAVSAGYYCDREWTSGVTADGQPYDCIQRNIRANHVALVMVGRAGPEARIRLDEDEAVLCDGETNQPKKEDKKMEKVTLDGIPVELPAQAAAIVAKALADRDSKLSAQAAQIQKLTSDAADATKRADTVSAERDGLAAQLKKAQDPALFNAAVAAREALTARARGIMGADFKTDGLDARAIKVAVIGKTTPDIKCDGQSDDYVNALFDMAQVKPASQTNAATATVAAQLAAGEAKPTTDSTDEDPFKASMTAFFTAPAQ